MTLIFRNVDLLDPPNSLDGYETCAAGAKNVVVYTGNELGNLGSAGAAYSLDWGEHFGEMDPTPLCQLWGESPCCDQVVIYIPKIDLFMWVIQTLNGNYVCALATPDEINATKGKLWHTFLCRPHNVGGDDTTDVLDYPELAVGDNFLYMTCDVANKAGDLKGCVCVRASFKDIYDAWLSGLHFYVSYHYFSEVLGPRPAQSTGAAGFFVGQKSTSELIVMQWADWGGFRTWVVPIESIPSSDWEVTLPDGKPPNWLDPTNKIRIHITGVTQRGNSLWVAWPAARKFEVGLPFPHPHIGLAIIDLWSGSVENHNMWHNSYALSWPSLTTNSNGDVGMSFVWGGNTIDPQFAVAVLSDEKGNFSPRRIQDTMFSIDAPNSRGGGGHFTSIRQSFPTTSAFCASGAITIRDALGKNRTHPYYVVFAP